MILLLGKRESIEEYINTAYEITDSFFPFYCPSHFDHHSEYGKYIDIIKSIVPSVVVTQSIEMVDVLLESDLEFDVVTLKNINRNIYERVMRKKEALELRDEFNFDLRD